jgi:hypothetical protein
LFKAQRLEELKLQIDELSRSKENLERSAFTLLEEIKVLKGKVDMEAMNLNSISGDMRNKTRKLEDENRAHVISLFSNRTLLLCQHLLGFELQFGHSLPLKIAFNALNNQRLCLCLIFIIFLNFLYKYF